MNREAPAEELRLHLRETIAEAIRMEISLEHLLRVFSSSRIEASNTDIFIDHVSKHYAYGITAARVTQEEKKEREETGRRSKKRIYEDS